MVCHVVLDRKRRIRQLHPHFLGVSVNIPTVLVVMSPRLLDTPRKVWVYIMRIGCNIFIYLANLKY